MRLDISQRASLEVTEKKNRKKRNNHISGRFIPNTKNRVSGHVLS